MARKEREHDPARTLRRMRNFAVAALLVVLVWLVASRVYVDTRSANAFDELYYSTLDARSSLAFRMGHMSPTVVASVLSACKSDRPRNEGSGGGYYGRIGHPLESIPPENSTIYLFGYLEDNIPNLNGFKALYWYIEDEGEENSDSALSKKCIVFGTCVFPSSLGGYSAGSWGTFNAQWLYYVDSKELVLYSVSGPIGDDVNGPRAYIGMSSKEYASRVFELDGADPLLMIERSRQAIRDVVLRGYLEGAGLSEQEVEAELSAVDPIIDDAVARARAIYLDGGDGE